MRLIVEAPQWRCELEIPGERIEAAGGLVRAQGIELDAELADGATLRLYGATNLRPTDHVVAGVFVPPERSARDSNRKA